MQKGTQYAGKLRRTDRHHSKRLHTITVQLSPAAPVHARQLLFVGNGEVGQLVAESGLPYLDLKHEYHEEYFRTLEKLLPGMHKCIEQSFISEHMLINREIMGNLIRDIEANGQIPGETFYEKIIHAIPPERLVSNSFSEFETYGTYVAFRRPMAYKLRSWNSFRYAGQFLDPSTIGDEDYEWLGKSFDALSFEKGHTVRSDHQNLFDNKEYQSKLSARQMLEIAQEEFKDSYIEVWNK